MRRFLFILLVLAGCHHADLQQPLSLIQIQDRNGLTETISNPERLTVYENLDFTSSQPYKKVLRVYKAEGKNYSKITTYHANGGIYQYLEAEEMRAHGAYKEWFPNGQLKIEARVIGGTADVVSGSQQDWLFDGLSRVWDDQGNLIATIPYEKGMMEGTSVYYYPSGQIEKEVPFIAGNLEGEVREYFPTGLLKIKTQYKKGHKEGPSISYFETGQIAYQEDYSDGLLRGGIYYDLQGKEISQIENGGGFQAIYEEGALSLIEFRMGHPNGLVKKFTPSGELQKVFRVKNGRKQGEEIEYYLSSEIENPSQKPLQKLVINWNESSIHGTVKTWYSNGNLQSQREYSHNQRTGPALAWYKEGSFMFLEEYEEDRLISGQYFKINKLEPVSTVANGKGVATLFDESGAFLRKVSYLKGKPIDPEN